MAHELVRTDPSPADDESDDGGVPLAVVVEAVAPLLRGWLHLVCFLLSFPAGLLVVASAPTARARTAAVVYAIGVACLFGVSAAYHRRRWSAVARPRMKRLDHATIFVMIAASYTPMCLLTLRESSGGRVLVVAWVGAGVGVMFALSGVAEKRVIGLVCYIGLGWLMVLMLPELARRLDVVDVVLLLAGGVLYTVGCIFMGIRWPNPYPSVFGYHEVWHLMVVGAVTCHYLVILSAVKTAV